WKAGEWRHVAASWGDSGRRLALSIDGRQVEAITDGVVIPAFATDFWVGSGTQGATPAEAVFDVLRISRRGCTESEIKAATEAVGGGVERLALEAPSGTLTAGARALVRATGRTKAGLFRDMTRDVAWSSSEPAVATMGVDGTLRAGRAGESTLTA